MAAKYKGFNQYGGNPLGLPSPPPDGVPEVEPEVVAGGKFPFLVGLNLVFSDGFCLISICDKLDGRCLKLYI